eukprot:maker-scaffold_5-snap-gene-16.3-mRNA-1 protein AED:0.02 eAED:0.02 QI:81/1/1/1/1/1/5/521/452
MNCLNKEVAYKLCYFFLLAYGASQGRFLTIFFKEKLELSELKNGEILSISSIMQVIGAPILTFIADKYIGRLALFVASIISTMLLFHSYILIKALLVPQETKEALYLVVRVVSSFCNSTKYSLLSADILSYLKEKQVLEQTGNDPKDKWGEYRAYGGLGWAVCSLFLGLALDYYQDSIVMVYCAYITGILTIVCGFACFERRKPGSLDTQDEEKMKLVGPQETSSKGEHNRKVLENPYMFFLSSFNSLSGMAFLVLTVVSAGGMVLVERLVFLYFVEDLKLSYFLCGVSVLITVAVEIPIFHYSKAMTENLTYNQMYVIGLVAFSSRVFVYSIIPEEHKTWILGVEWLHGITIGTTSLARTLKIAEYAPREFETTFQGIGDSLVAFGFFCGTNLGSLGFKHIGKRWTYRASAIIMLISTAIFYMASTSDEVKSKEYEKIDEKESQEQSDSEG